MCFIILSLSWHRHRAIANVLSCHCTIANVLSCHRVIVNVLPGHRAIANVLLCHRVITNASSCHRVIVPSRHRTILAMEHMATIGFHKYVYFENSCESWFVSP